MGNFKRRKKLLIGILSIGIASATGATAIAMNSKESMSKMSLENDYSMQEFVNKLDKTDVTSNIDLEKKETLDSITTQAKSLKLTKEESLELRKQRIALPAKEKKTDTFKNIEDNAKEKIREVVQQVIAGTISKEKAINQLQKLNLPPSVLAEVKEAISQLKDNNQINKREVIKKQS
ncbi:hypothetical protein [Bacillus kwashiorkori]|uniref:hypothetical protein n=1 Tax=Bacillus kwashiorkori TaxID=1522318 RepID=UPI000780DF84|nr:hypothetical protein [Bacillus kwashiorkori]